MLKHRMAPRDRRKNTAIAKIMKSMAAAKAWTVARAWTVTKVLKLDKMLDKIPRKLISKQANNETNLKLNELLQRIHLIYILAHHTPTQQHP